MAVDTLPDSNYQARLRLSLETLLYNKKPLAKEAVFYINTCRQEGKSARTIELYTLILRDFIDYNNHLRPTANDIREFLLYQHDRGVKPSTVHIYYRTLKSFFNWLVREEIFTRSPMVNVKAPKLPKVVIMPFTLDDIKRMLVVCQGKRFVDVRNTAIIKVYLDTGVRLFEMAGMNRADVNEHTGVVRIRLGKGQKDRIVQIGSLTQKALSRYLYMRDDDLPALWLTEERHPLTRDGLKIALRRVAKLAEITDARLGAHTFRHTFAINFLRNKGDVFTLQEILGHTTLTMTRRYTQALSGDDIARVHKTASPVDNWKL